ncbi:MAG: carboxypeptidase regulatory-like domain-containing protein [Acidimicrobiales bacterium]
MVRGAITDRATGAPLAGAKVTLRTPAGGVVEATTTTDGTYLFGTVADGLYKLRRTAAYTRAPTGRTPRRRGAPR